jgi:hypothetical protein
MLLARLASLTSLARLASLARPAWLACFAAIAAGVGILHADTLVMKDGRRIEGTLVSESADLVRIQTRLGALEFKRAEIASIEHSKSRSQEFTDREAAAKSAEDFYQLGLWAEREKLKSEAQKSMERAIAIDAKHAGAHTWLGHVLYKDEWMTAAERDERMAKDLEAEMLARGLVKWEDRWVSPADREHLAKGEVLEDGKWMSPESRNRLHGLEEFDGRWLPRAEALARGDVARVASIAKVPLPLVMTDDAVVAGTLPQSVLTEIAEGLKRGRAWFDRVFRGPSGLELFGGRRAELYVFDNDDPYLATIAHFNSLTTTLPPGWAEAVADTHGFFFADPYPLSSARLWKRAQGDLVGHCYHHWGHLLAHRLGYDGRLLPPWYEEGIAALLEFRSHERNAVFCRGHASVSEVAPTGPTTGGGKKVPTTKGVKPSTATAPKVSSSFDPKDLREGRWQDALKAGLAAKKGTPFAELVTRQFTELESADLAAAMGIVEWLESKDALRAFHDELRKSAPQSPQRILENTWEREACYERAFQAAVKMGWKEADQAWRQWFLTK